MTTMQVELAGETHLLQPGRLFTMGRTGDLVIDDTAFLRHQCLTLSFRDGLWWLANNGDGDEVTLTDPTGRLRSTIGPGNHLPLLLTALALTFSAGPYSYELNLTVESAPMELIERPARGQGAHSAISGTSFTASQLLVILAIAEPLLRRVGHGVWPVPTVAQASRRLGWTTTKFNRKVDNVCDKLDRAGVPGLKGAMGRQANGRRALLAEYAVNARIITSRHLPLLEEELAQNLERARRVQ